jgi:hypothetical protein
VDPFAVAHDEDWWWYFENVAMNFRVTQIAGIYLTC